jgi:hypothetical protein
MRQEPRTKAVDDQPSLVTINEKLSSYTYLQIIFGLIHFVMSFDTVDFYRVRCLRDL